MGKTVFPLRATRIHPMKPTFALAFAAVPLLCAALSLPCRADEASAAARAGEPQVQHTVIEDEGSRIEETRVRGQTQRVTVTPKVGIRQGYEIVPADGARDMSDGPGSSRGAAGKRVWHVLSF
jgi:hypothetical protein